ncbi:hypothetical protein K437DRAFT_253415 [Tilletiaria anomala UBC 951]|uniref:Prefoldin n=1 Tax=Tilletiaria anomala (strain ATCC 24038 / CBS 436.72 / UBC 951) TaxID=1037660 RepID=A0A066WGH0_TILAU|nr:uncharacterized protein K437DRAFT_253415 [Tilletiaria anomala UBC 951]KDN53092.1 hypothetical protein K437DRAFT_253415 [Tilletiaria anomala UBC 951]
MAPQGLPEEQLHRILQEIQTQAITAQRQLNMVRAQVASKDREKRMHALTLKQIDEEKDAIGLYRGVGKMFMMEDRDVLLKELHAKEKDAAEEISNLTKKQKFLEKQFSDSQAHLRDIFSGMDRQAASA